MNSIHNNGENDKSLNDGLDELGHVYGKLEKDEPPELLDMAILNSAHRAVEKQPRRMKFGWLHGLTTTAVFVLAFSLILEQRKSAPVFEDGMRSTQPAPLQRETVAKKQAGDVQGELRKEMTPKSDARVDDFQTMSAVTAQESEQKAGQSRNLATQPQHSNLTLDVISTKAEPVDQDLEAEESMLEKTSLDETAFIADAPKVDASRQRATPAAIAAAPPMPVEAEAHTEENSQSEAEQQLMAILKLKQSGDPGWELQLESFIERYPDYPLPPELRNP